MDRMRHGRDLRSRQAARHAEVEVLRDQDKNSGLEPGGLNVERVRTLHPGDTCPHSADTVRAYPVPV